MVYQAGIGWRARWGLLVALLWVATGCRSVEDLLPEPTVLTPSGDFTHSGSGFTFPESIGDFDRVVVRQYDEAGKDVSVGYNLDSPDFVAATVYVYPGRDILNLGSNSDVVAVAKDFFDEEQFEGAKDAILAATPGLTLLSEDTSFEISSPNSQLGRRAIFQGRGVIDGSLVLMRTEIDLFGLGDWFIKYRFTYSAASSDAPAQVSEFMDSLQWPKD